MKDYGRIITKINQTPWLITPEGLDLVLTIVSDRINNGRLEDTELDTRLASVGGKARRDDGLQVINGVGILPVGGPIFGKANLMTNFSGATSLESFQQDLRTMLADDTVGSIIMDMDTPGGTSDLVEEVGDEIFNSRGIKPIYASVNTMCGSAGLWLATQANKVFSTPSGSIGSLGAYTAHKDQSVADAKDGIKFTYISAGEYKTEGNPHEPLSADAIRHRQEVINSLMSDFVGAVARGRGADPQVVAQTYGQGRMLMPQTALEVGMIDGIMSFDSLLNQLTKATPRQVSVVIPGRAEPIAATMIDESVHFNTDWLKENLELITEIGKERNSVGLPVLVNPLIREEDEAMKLSDAALTALGLSTSATEDEVSAAVISLSDKATPMIELKNSIDSQKAFAEMFPEEAKQMAALQASNRVMEAKAFANSYKDTRFADVIETEETNEDGSKRKVVKPTTKGLSGLALQEIESTHLKFGEGTVQLEDFKGTIDAILTGVVDYGVKGTEQQPIEDSTGISGMNIFEIRTKFAELVVGEQTKAKANNVELSDNDAMKMVAEKHPKLWEYYKNPAALMTAVG